MKIIKRIIKVLITIILLIILSFNLFNLVSIKILGNELPKINGYAYLEVISGSMEPKIKKGDIIIIDTKVKKYKAKDIITFKDVNGSFVTHRIIEINDDKLITKGDANNTIDDAINKKDIVGRYVYQINGAGALIKSLRSPFILVMILVIGILLCVLVSTDSKGNAILTEEEKEYMDFLESKNKKKKEKTETSKQSSTNKKKNKESKINKDDKKEIKTDSKKTNEKKSTGKKTSNKQKNSTTTNKKTSNKNVVEVKKKQNKTINKTTTKKTNTKKKQSTRIANEKTTNETTKKNPKKTEK